MWTTFKIILDNNYKWTTAVKNYESLLYTCNLHNTLHQLYAKSLQSCPILCDPMNCSPPGSSVHGILQARIMEWIAISYSKGSSLPRDQTHLSYVFYIGRWVLNHKCHLGNFNYASIKINKQIKAINIFITPPALF